MPPSKLSREAVIQERLEQICGPEALRLIEERDALRDQAAAVTTQQWSAQLLASHTGTSRSCFMVLIQHGTVEGSIHLSVGHYRIVIEST